MSVAGERAYRYVPSPTYRTTRRRFQRSGRFCLVELRSDDNISHHSPKNISVNSNKERPQVMRDKEWEEKEGVGA